MITKNSLNVVKEYSIPCVNRFNGDYRVFTIMARSFQLAIKVFRTKFKSWRVQRDALSERLNVNVNGLFPFDDNVPQQRVDMRIVRKMNPTFDDDVKLDKMLSRWIGC